MSDKDMVSPYSSNLERLRNVYMEEQYKQYSATHSNSFVIELETTLEERIRKIEIMLDDHTGRISHCEDGIEKCFDRIEALEKCFNQHADMIYNKKWNCAILIKEIEELKTEIKMRILK